MVRHFAPRAQADLDELVSWILDHGSAGVVAERLLDSVLEAADRLAARPLLGRRRPDMLPDPFRFWSILRHSLLLIYVADPAAPTILRVLSTDRDLGSILSEILSNQDSIGEISGGWWSSPPAHVKVEQVVVAVGVTGRPIGRCCPSRGWIGE